METDIIYNEDCLEGLSKIPDKSIDLIVIDPPYNIGIDEWDIIPNYLKFMEDVIIQLKRVLKDNGSFYIWNSAEYVAEIKVLCSKHKFILNSWIIWNKKSKQQNSTRSYADITEHCLFFTLQKDDLKYGETGIFDEIRNYMDDERKKLGLKKSEINKLLGFSTNGGGMACHYFSRGNKIWELPTEEAFKRLNEIGFNFNYQKLKKWKDSLIEEWEKLRFTFNHIEIGEKRNPNDKRKFSKDVTNPINVWEHQNTHELNKIGHTTPKPLSLIKKIIMASSKEGQIVLDCFMGSGTTALACKELNRRFIGFEISPEYCKIISKRLSQQTLSNLSGFIHTQTSDEVCPSGHLIGIKLNSALSRTQKAEPMEDKMKKERIQKMVDMIENLKMIVHPAIIEFSMDEWEEVYEKLRERRSTIQGASIIIDAMGGNSQEKELKVKFQSKMMEAMYSYAKCIHEANEISKEIKEFQKTLISNQQFINKL